ncbi:MAG: LamG-like jellyroll fold domain-containing protein, partial [Verrucomicrobiota bacterium]
LNPSFLLFADEMSGVVLSRSMVPSGDGDVPHFEPIDFPFLIYYWTALTAEFSRHNQDTLYFATANYEPGVYPDYATPTMPYQEMPWGIWKTTDRGYSWEQIYSIPDGSYETKWRGKRTIMEDPSGTRSDQLYFGSSSRGLLRTTDSGTTWNVVHPQLSGRAIRTIDAGVDSSGDTVMYVIAGLDMPKHVAGELSPAYWGTINNADAKAGYIASWDFEGNANDGSDNDYDLTLSGSPSYTQEAMGLQRSMNFDGTNDYASIDTLTYNSTYQQHTVAAWIRMDPTGLNDSHVIASYDRFHYWQLAINIDTAGPGEVIWQVRGSDNLEYKCTSGTALVNDGKWHHVTATFNNGQMNLYINGELAGSTTAHTTFGTGIARTGHIAAGTTGEDSDPFSDWRFNGDLDQVRIYPMALSDYEIAGLAKGFAYDFYTWNAAFASQGELYRVDISPGNGDRVSNGNFSAGQADWTLWPSTTDGAAASLSVVGGEAVIDVTAGGTSEWHIQFFQDGIVIEEGTEFTVTFDARCTTGTMPIRGQVREQDFSNTYNDNFTLDTQMKPYSFTFTPVAGTENARIEFYLGAAGANTVIIDNVTLGISGATEDITVTQLYPEHQDFVDISVDPTNAAKAFVLRKAKSGTGDMGGRELHKFSNYGTGTLTHVRTATGLSRFGSVNINPADHKHIVMSTSREADLSKSLLYSTNRGGKWKQVNRSTSVTSEGYTIVPSIDSYAPMVAYTYDDGGSPIKTGAGTTTDLTDILFVPGDRDKVLWAEVSHGLLRSTDRGATFSSYGVGGTNKDTYQIAVGPYGQRIIVGMLESGYNVTNNGGLFWEGVHHHNDAGIISSSDRFTGSYGRHQGFGVGINQDDPDQVAIIHSGDEHILISSDGGASFTDQNISTNGGKRVFWPRDDLLYASDKCADNAGQLLRTNTPLVWRDLQRRVIAVSASDPNVILGVYNPTDPAGFNPSSIY